MAENDNQILADEIAHLGTSAVAQFLTRFVAKLLPSETYEVSLETAVQPASVVDVAMRILCAEGSFLRAVENAGTVQVKGLVGAGALKMNPTIISISITALPHSPTGITIQGKAKEGLIKQHTAEKAAQRVAHLLFDHIREMS